MRVMTFKELIQFRRDIFLLIVVVYAFSADIYIAGSGIEMELKQAALTVADYDQSPASRDLIYSFRQPQFKYQGMEMSGDRAMDLLDAGKTMLYLEIPRTSMRRCSAVSRPRCSCSSTPATPFSVPWPRAMPPRSLRVLGSRRRWSACRWAAPWVVACQWSTAPIGSGSIRMGAIAGSCPSMK